MPNSITIRTIPTLAQIRDRGWTCAADRFGKWRQLGPNYGHHKNFDIFSGAYTICTDGVHIIVWNRSADQWSEVHLLNWVGPISPHEVSVGDWDWQDNRAKLDVPFAKGCRPKNAREYAGDQGMEKLDKVQLHRMIDELL